MKKILLTAGIILSGLVYSQVGVNNQAPFTTFDVRAKRDASGNITDNTQIIGLQAPRLTRAELTANTATYGTNQNGALIYITDISGGNANAGTQRENITNVGYYYFDAAAASGAGRWVKMAVGNGGSLYTANNGLTMTGNNTKLGGTLIENTTIAQGNNSMTFSGNSNVNITTTNASGYPLSVIHPLSGSISQPGLQIGGASGTAATGQAAFIGFNPNNGQGAWPISVGAQYISGSAGQGAADFFVATSSGAAADKKLIVKNNGNVGIGITTPSAKLEIQSTAGVAPLKVSTLNTQPASANAAYVTVDNSTGEFYKAGQSEKAFYYQTYNISNVDGDYLSNYDTKISTSDYTLIIVGSYFDQLLGVNQINSSINRFSPQNVFAFKDTTTNTWRLSADFLGATSRANNASDNPQQPSGKWTIYTMIVRNNQVITNSDVNANLSGTSTGSATASPVP